MARRIFTRVGRQLTQLGSRLGASRAAALVSLVVALTALGGAWACRAYVPAAAPIDAAPPRPQLVSTVTVDLGAVALPAVWARAGGADRTLEASSLRASGGQLVLPGPVRLAGQTHGGDVTVQLGTDGRARARTTLPLETYVAGVVAAELPLWSAEEEELCAQAIAARTFALHAVQRRGGATGLVAGVQDQAYRGTYVVPASSPSRGALAAADRLARAMERTRGVVLMRGGAFEEARYHASCGGSTSSFAEVFSGEAARGALGPLGAPCPPCAARASAESAARRPDSARPLGWTVKLGPTDLADLGRAAGLSGPVKSIAPRSVDRGGRWISAALRGASGDERVVSWELVRRTAGYGRVKSAMIVAQRPAAARPIQGELLLQGLGRGHGVGLCQESARSLAAQGWTHQQILRHYYPGSTLTTLDEASRAR